MKQPTEITSCKLECIVMPNGEVICNGKTLGYFKDLEMYLEVDPKMQKDRNIAMELCDLIESFDRHYAGSDTLFAGENAFQYDFEYENQQHIIILQNQ